MTERGFPSGEPTWAPERPERFRDAMTRPKRRDQLVISAARRISRGRSYNYLRLVALSSRLFSPYLLLNARLLLGGPLGKRQTELVILRTAVRCGCRYIWAQHEARGRRFGLTEPQIAALATLAAGDGGASSALPPHDLALMTAVDELVAVHCLSDETWEALRSCHSSTAVFELCTLTGSYALLAGALNSFGTPLEPVRTTATARRAPDRLSREPLRT